MFVINGFYMSMREKYTKPGSSIHYFVVNWSAKDLSWEDFRGKVLGATDPAESAEGSLRKHVADNWESLGLKAACNVGDNGVHGSASPFEAMAERMNWLSVDLKDDSFGSALLARGVDAEKLMSYTKDPQVDIGGGKTGSFFDSVEDTNSDDCATKTAKTAGVDADCKDMSTNEAFIFIKPHAVTEKTIEYIKGALAKAGMKILKEGSLAAEVIESKQLIDNHYYAIANKASLTLPKDLNPPEAKIKEFGEKFGITWEQALKDGIVFNAVDGCKQLNIDGDAMNTMWAAAKKGKQMVKFGGGFYAGKVQ